MNALIILHDNLIKIYVIIIYRRHTRRPWLFSITSAGILKRRILNFYYRIIKKSIEIYLKNLFLKICFYFLGNM